MSWKVSTVRNVAVQAWRRLHVGPDGTVCAFGYGEMVVSKDGGEHWALHEIGKPSYISDGCVDAHGAIFVAGEGALAGLVLCSNDAGASWQERKVPGEVFRAFSVSPERILLLGETSLVASTDRGATWSVVGSMGEPAIARALLESGDALIVASDRGVLRAKVVGEPFATAATSDLHDVCDDGRGRLIAVGVAMTVLLSDDRGVSWRRPKRSPRGKKALYAVAARGGRAVLVGASGVLLASSDAGETWSPVAHELADPRKKPVDLTSVAIQDDRIVVGSRWGQLALGAFR